MGKKKYFNELIIIPYKRNMKIYNKMGKMFF